MPYRSEGGCGLNQQQNSSFAWPFFVKQLRQRDLQSEGIVSFELTKPCTLYKRVMIHANATEEGSWHCLLDPKDGEGLVNVPKDLSLEGAIFGGETTLYAPGLRVIDNQVVLEGLSNVIFGETRRRNRHLSIEGELKVTVVRVTCMNLPPVTKSLEEIKGDVFTDDACLKSQLEGCSQRKVSVTEGSLGGGIEITLASCPDATTTENQVTKKIIETRGISPMDNPDTYFMYYLPFNNFFAYAYATGPKLTVYGNETISSVSAQMHAFGTLFGLGQAQEGSVKFGDMTGYMGFIVREDDTKRCYNAANMDQLGWLDDVAEFSSDPPGEFVLRGHTNPNTEGDTWQAIHPTGIPLGNETYIWFNDATGINANTGMGKNQVIVNTRPTGTGRQNSLLVAMLETGGTYSPGDAYYSLRVLEIRDGAAVVSLALPSSKPSLMPSLMPSKKPKPTAKPTEKPTPKPCSSFNRRQCKARSARCIFVAGRGCETRIL